MYIVGWPGSQNEILDERIPEVIFTPDVLDRFANLLMVVMRRQERMSEDGIRYCLFTSIRERLGVGDAEIVIEHRHPKIKGVRLDCFLPASPKHGAAVWELKYDRAIPSGGNQPRSNKAGSLLNDFFRLAAVDEPQDLERIVIYLTDAEMASYFRNPRNGLDALFDLGAGAKFRIDANLLASRAPSVRNKIKVPVLPCYAVGKFATGLSARNELRLWEVRLA